MNPVVKRLISIAEAEVGYLAKATNAQLDEKEANIGDGIYHSGNEYTKYARDLFNAGYYNGNKNGYDWCDVFVDWCFYQLCDRDAKKAQHLICQTGTLGAGCLYSMGYYKDAGRFYTTKPEPGDQIFFSWGHTGLVYAVDSENVYTIEGNTTVDNKPYGVYKKSKAINNANILGYGRPRFEELDGLVVDALFDIILNTVSACDAIISINPDKDFNVNSYKWTYVLTNLISDSSTRENQLDSQNLEIASLIPNTPYALKITAKNADNTLVQQLFFATTKERPEPISSLNVSFNNKNILNSSQCTIAFDPPKNWGTSISDKGYRVSLIVNNKIIPQEDLLLKTNNLTIKTEKLFKDAKISHGDTVQIGIQTWIKDSNGELIFDAEYPVCSKPVFINHDLNVIHSIYIKILNNVKQAILYM